MKGNVERRSFFDVLPWDVQISHQERINGSEDNRISFNEHVIERHTLYVSLPHIARRRDLLFGRFSHCIIEFAGGNE